MNIESVTHHTDGPSTSAQWIRSLSRVYPDFPSPGILFQDLTPVFAHGQAFGTLVDELCALVELSATVEQGAPIKPGVVAIAGVEARGFLLAAAMAQKTGCGVLAVRKAGKLPGAVLSESYALEYGTATLEVHPDALEPGSRVVLVDDLLASGGTLAAAIRLIERLGCEITAVGVAVELEGLGGRAKLDSYRVESLVRS